MFLPVSMAVLVCLVLIEAGGDDKQRNVQAAGLNADAQASSSILTACLSVL